jgi:hypothetical protein
MVSKKPSVVPRIPPTRRVVILGASNVTLGLSTVVEAARNAWGRPSDLMIAAGHGRSYGLSSSVLGRRLPAITSCALWDQLAERPELPTAALVTDIGNDLIYGCQVDLVLSWVETCLQRLYQQVDRLVVTRLPWESISAITPGKYRFLRSLLFPKSRVSLDDILVRAEEINHHLVQFANRYHAYVIHPDRQWYGWDPIHVARKQRSAAWQKILSCWSDGRPSMRTSHSWRRSWMLRKARPYAWQRFGMDRHQEQPTCMLPDGSVMSLY